MPAQLHDVKSKSNVWWSAACNSFANSILIINFKARRALKAGVSPSIRADAACGTTTCRVWAGWSCFRALTAIWGCSVETRQAARGYGFFIFLKVFLESLNLTLKCDSVVSFLDVIVILPPTAQKTKLPSSETHPELASEREAWVASKTRWCSAVESEFPVGGARYVVGAESASRDLL